MNDKLSISIIICSNIFSIVSTRTRVELFRTAFLGRNIIARCKWTTECNRIRANHGPGFFPRLHDTCNKSSHVERGRLPSFALFPLPMKPEVIGGQVLMPAQSDLTMTIGGRDVTRSKSSKLPTTIAIVMHPARVKRTALFPPEIFLLARNVYRARWKFLLLGSFSETTGECAFLRDFITAEMKKKEEKTECIVYMYKAVLYIA